MDTSGPRVMLVTPRTDAHLCYTFQKDHADSSFSPPSADAQLSLSGIDSFMLLDLSSYWFSKTMAAATKMLKQLRCSWVQIKIQFLFWKIGFLWHFHKCNKTQREGFLVLSLYRTCHCKKFPGFEGKTAGMLTLGKVPETSSVFPTMLSVLARSRMIQCCVSKRSSCTLPGLVWYPSATARSGAASDNWKVFQLENK